MPDEGEQAVTVGGSWAKLHGQGSLQLHTSNQSPRRCQSTAVEVRVITFHPFLYPLGVFSQVTVALETLVRKYP